VQLPAIAAAAPRIKAKSFTSATVFARACRLGAEGIVSEKIDGTYRSGPCPAWIKVCNPASIAGAAGAQRKVARVNGSSGPVPP
jgi:hypothetical protein